VVSDTRYKLDLIREVRRGLDRVVDNQRILVAVEYLRSGEAKDWPTAIRMARAALASPEEQK
jgi:hypothetical protein